MRVVVLTQEDYFFLPKNIDRLCDKAEVVGIANIVYKSALSKKQSDFAEWFGLYQVMRLGIRVAVRLVQGFADKITGYTLYGGHCSIQHIAAKRSIPYICTSDVNSGSFFEIVKKLAPDLIISFSAPQVIKEPLLSFPQHGIINVHGSYLPHYRGCLPSFWYLYNNEKIGGATVHYMSAAIDDGDILVQGFVDISNCSTMFEVMRRTKELGGKLLLTAIQKIESNNNVRIKNEVANGRYYTWPTKDDGFKFRQMGKRLI